MPKGASWAEPIIVIKDVNYRVDGKGYTKRGYSHVFEVTAAGGTPRQITTGSYNEAGPLAWSPDGKDILLATNREADSKRPPISSSGSHPRHMNIYRLNVANGSLTALNPQRVGSFRHPLLLPMAPASPTSGSKRDELAIRTTPLPWPIAMEPTPAQWLPRLPPRRSVRVGF